MGIYFKRLLVWPWNLIAKKNQARIDSVLMNLAWKVLIVQKINSSSTMKSIFVEMFVCITCSTGV